jgi:hypothetical protein
VRAVYSVEVTDKDERALDRRQKGGDDDPEKALGSSRKTLPDGE